MVTKQYGSGNKGCQFSQPSKHSTVFPKILGIILFFEGHRVLKKNIIIEHYASLINFQKAEKVLSILFVENNLT